MKRAEQLGFTREINQTFKFPDSDYEVTIDAVWYNETGGYIFYNVNTPDVFDVMFRVSPVNIENRVGNTTYRQNLDPENRGVIFDGKFYSRVAFAEFRNRELQPIEQIDSILIDDITLNMGEEEFYLFDVPTSLDIHFNKKNEIINRYPINQEINVNDHRLSLEYLELGTDKNTLVFGFESKNPATRFSKINGEFESGENPKYSFGFGERDENGLITISFPPSDEEPSHVNLLIHSIELVGEDSLSFEINLEDYLDEISTSKEKTEPIENPISQNLGVFRNTEVFLEKLIFVDGSVMVGLYYDKPADLKKPFEQLSDGVMAWMHPLFSTDETVVIANALDIHNEENKHISESGDYGSSFGGPDSHFGFELPKNFVAMSKQVKVNFNNLLYEIVGDWEMRVEIATK